jgi:hypothetical protein
MQKKSEVKKSGSREEGTLQPSQVFPRMRWAAMGWLAVWAPAYAIVWGWKNLLLLCDLAVLLTCVGLWRGSALLLSSQAVSSIIVDVLWSLDAAWRLLFSKHLIGGTEYMWDARFPLGVRLLSLFHVVWPALLVWALGRVGYDPRGFWLQSGLAVAVLWVSRLVGPARNLNFAFRDPILDRSWGPAPMHLALTLGALVLLLYWPTHQVLLRSLPRVGAGSNHA